LYDAYRQSMMIVTKMIEHYNIPPEDVNKMQLNIIENMVFIKTYADYLGFKDHLAKIRASTDPDDIEQKQVDLWIKFILMREKGNQQNSEKENLTSDINLNLDTILEKINDSGMDSLTKDEKTFLTNQK